MFSSSHWPANLLIKIDDMFPKVQVLMSFPSHVAKVNVTLYILQS